MSTKKLDLGSLPYTILAEVLSKVPNDSIYGLRLLNKRMNSLIMDNFLNLEIRISFLRKYRKEEGYKQFYFENCNKAQGLSYELGLNKIEVISKFINIINLNLEVWSQNWEEELKILGKMEFPYLKAVKIALHISINQEHDRPDYSISSLFQHVESFTLELFTNGEDAIIYHMLNNLNVNKIKYLKIHSKRIILKMEQIGPIICSFSNLETLDINSYLDLGGIYNSSIIAEINSHKLKNLYLSGRYLLYEGDELDVDLNMFGYNDKNISQYGQRGSNFNCYLKEMVNKPSLENLVLNFRQFWMGGPTNPFIIDYENRSVEVNENIKSISFVGNVSEIQFDFTKFTKLKKICIDCSDGFKESLSLISLKNISYIVLSNICTMIDWKWLIEQPNINNNVKRLLIQRCHFAIHYLILLIKLFPNLESVQFKNGKLEDTLPEYDKDYYIPLFEKMDIGNLDNEFIKKPILFMLGSESYSGSKETLMQFEKNKNVSIWNI